MADVTIRDLRNHGAEVLARVANGESLTITRDGDPVAELRPLPRRPLSARQLLRRWWRLPAVDPARLRADIYAALEPTL